MKAIRIDFIADRRWVWVWTVSLAVSIGIAAGYGRLLRQSYLARQETRQAIKLISQEIEKLTRPAVVPVDPRQADAQKVASLLQLDLNPLFTTIERLQEPGIRLSSLSLDVPSDTARLEYALDSVSKASKVTELLNEGYESKPWQLVSVGAVAARSYTQGIGPPQGFTGTWFVQLARLK